jgi:ABC-2 type transport system ATP-binding protein
VTVEGTHVTVNAIEATALVKDYGRKRAIDGVDLTVASGDVFGLLGNNGAGKTTTLHVLLGLLAPTSGHARVLGLDPATDRIGVLRTVGFFAETDAPYDWLTIDQLCHVGELSYPTWDGGHCADLLRSFGLDPSLRIATLSKGMLAKAKLVLALAHRPRLIVLDEPTSGLDPGSRLELHRLLVTTAEKGGTTIVFSSHDLDEVARISTRIAILAGGRIALSAERSAIDRMTITRLTSGASAGPAPRAPEGVRSRSSASGWEWLSEPAHETGVREALEAAALDGWEARAMPATLADVFHHVVSGPAATVAHGQVTA